MAFAITDRLVLSQIRDKLGGQLHRAVSGGAALPRDVAELIDALGIDVFAGYGLTETSPLVSVNFQGAQRMGSVGKPIPGVKVLIDEQVEGHKDDGQGEVIVLGPNVMKGYHHRDEETRAAMTEDGGFRTGDLGCLDGDGFLFILGRRKEQYKLESGRYVVPGHLEEQLKQSPYILHALIYGEDRPYNVALLAANPDALAKWAKKEGLSFSGTEAMLRSERVKEHLRSEVERCSQEYRLFEKIQDIALADEEFTAENGLLTHTLKLRRREVWQKYGKRILALYEKDKS